MEQKVFFHVDLDAFFASVEQRDHPEYRGKPLIIGVVAPRCVVSTCYYEARKFGVHSAMPTMQAYRLCPQGIYIPGDMHLYSRVSKHAFLSSSLTMKICCPKRHFSLTTPLLTSKLPNH